MEGGTCQPTVSPNLAKPRGYEAKCWKTEAWLGGVAGGEELGEPAGGCWWRYSCSGTAAVVGAAGSSRQGGTRAAMQLVTLFPAADMGLCGAVLGPLTSPSPPALPRRCLLPSPAPCLCPCP